MSARKTHNAGGDDGAEFDVPDVSEALAVVGMTRMGKSHFAKRWAGWLTRQDCPVLCLDYRAEWGVDGVRRAHNSLGPLRRTLTVSKFLDDPGVILAPRLSLAICPDDLRSLPEERADGFRRVLPFLRQRSDDQLHLWIDEVGMLAPYLEAELHDICATWGADGVRRYLISQRWTDLPPAVRAQLTRVVSFRQCKASDLRYLATDTDRDFARRVAKLEPRQHLTADLTRASADTLSHAGLED